MQDYINNLKIDRIRARYSQFWDLLSRLTIGLLVRYKTTIIHSPYSSWPVQIFAPTVQIVAPTDIVLLPSCIDQPLITERQAPNEMHNTEEEAFSWSLNTSTQRDAHKKLSREAKRNITCHCWCFFVVLCFCYFIFIYVLYIIVL